MSGLRAVNDRFQRIEVAQKLGLAEVPTIDLSWLSPAQRQAYVLADNRLAEEAVRLFPAGFRVFAVGLDVLRRAFS